MLNLGMNYYGVPSVWNDRYSLGVGRGDNSMDKRPKLKKDGWAGHVARMGPKRNACRILVGKPGGNIPL
jgi:hypothetical protein